MMPKIMDLVADLHLHTLASGHAYSTVSEIVHLASAKGLQAIALTDHGPAMPGGPHRYHFGNLSVLPEIEGGVLILRGVEANILDSDGTLDLPEIYLKLLDLVWAGLHVPCLQPSTRSINTRALLNALDNPYVDGIVHPGNPEFVIDEEAVVQAAKEKNKLLEINNSSFLIRRGSKTRCAEIARLVKHYDGVVAINSDAHLARDVGCFDKGLQLALEAELESRHVLNTSLESIKDFLKSRGKKRFQRD